MPRREDRALITGAGRFVDDLPIPGALHLALVRSPHAHARVVAIDLGAALQAPGAIAIFTAKDLDEIAPMPVNRLFEPMVVPPHPILASDIVRAQGTPVAAIVADSAYHAADAAALVAVEYEPLAGVASAADALAPGAPPVLIEAPGNRAFAHRWRAGDATAALTVTHRVVSVSARQQLLAGVPLETRAVAARWDATTDELTLWTSTQVPFRIRAEVARMLALDEGRVRVIAPDVGGGFGVKGGPYREEPLVAWLARRLARPVKWTATRVEDFVTTHHARGDRDGLTRARPRWHHHGAPCLDRGAARIEPDLHGGDDPAEPRALLTRRVRDTGRRHRGGRRADDDASGRLLPRRRSARGGLLDRAPRR